jgi:hypothetical protein
MPTDANIILQTQPVQTINPLDMAVKVMTLKNLGMKNQTEELQNQELQRQADSKQGIRDAYKQNMTVGPDGNPTVDMQGFMNQAMQADPAGAMQISQEMRKNQAAISEAQLQRLQVQHKYASELLDDIPMGSDVDPATKQSAWTTMKAKAATFGLPNSGNVPDQYPGDAFVNHMRVQLLGAKDQLEQQNKQIDQGIAQQKNDIENNRLGLEYKKLYGGGAGGAPGSGAPVDPSTLVSRMVPEGKQKDVFEEIKNAQDISSLTPKILDAFDRGSSRDPIVARQGQKEFEGLINTTVKEQEGTARQAAFDSIHEKMTPSGPTALPGDNLSKKRTVVEYLGSKAAAPTAKGFGIDLSKFPSTSVPNGTVRMRDPKGNIRDVNLKDVEAAKNAGGTLL